jgi:hypothetical protein
MNARAVRLLVILAIITGSPTTKGFAQDVATLRD